MKKTFRVEGAAPVRLDILLAGVFDEMSRSKITEKVKRFGVHIDGKLVKKPGAITQPDTEVMVDWPELAHPSQVEPNADLPCEILYEDSNCVIVNKAAGLLTHPTADPASFRMSAASWLVAHIQGKNPGGDAQRPGIVHRLDQWTSGCLLLAKTEEALRFYATAFEQRTVIKEYLALVEGILEFPEGTIDAPIGRDHKHRTAMGINDAGRQAKTSYTVLDTGTWNGVAVSLLRLRLHTGRTHQIRVHLAGIGHPVVGDPTYGARIHPSELSGQWLHALQLTIPKMGAEGETITAKASLPPAFLQVLTQTGIPHRNLAGMPGML